LGGKHSAPLATKNLSVARNYSGKRRGELTCKDTPARCGQIGNRELRSGRKVLALTAGRDSSSLVEGISKGKREKSNESVDWRRGRGRKKWSG